MDLINRVRETLAGEWVPTIYSEKVRSQRTRSVALNVPEKLNDAEILYTLLGIELKVGKVRITCPDLAAARYLRVFARFGCREIAMPYDITRISPIADELETSWQRALILLADSAAGRSQTGIKRLRSALAGAMRAEIASIGAGENMPEFKQSTSQRKPSS